LRLSREVAQALDDGLPIVALESTVIAHGLPRPRNLELARDLEALLRSGGVTPATVAVVDGVPTIGLDEDSLVEIATGADVQKLSTRELPLAVARGRTGGTTVAATAFLSVRAGIQVFATGGIGGVHRGPLPDISADLLELRDSQLIVVCAGAKSILDLAATREALETLGVLVVGWRTDRFPGFYTRDGGVGVDVSVERAEEVADLYRAQRRMGAPGSLLLCAPVPEEQSLEVGVVEQWISAAVREAESLGIGGKAVTPFLLGRLAEASGGAALEANLALLKQNAQVAGAVAVALSGGERDR
jgi:pseudouridylate synthase